ncbi:pentapeptide repeat-containing protein [Klebsiella michiganensis]|uniref:pentapeptide repeat-containing protein n=1 Tax=Klebsiella michiganensis TaxID=1134687 RepID=UPI001CCC1316|nr:pentapeptide repeat-containing protein [Klebsiella michiganensis]MBZ6860969.1 pentapeptide repeat-containing protein [Klebsiella michiganensis]MBZ7420923.1 pentapeptide repeat-containing protein [Klebsiella michiganensis]
MNTAELQKILDEHKVWVESCCQRGDRANLRGADLSDANLSYANLRGANLRDANLSYANLRGANLRGADLSDANLSYANLRGANLRGANLRGANLRGADLSDANLSYANLRGANLRGANLSYANLRGADLPDLTFVIMGMEYAITITNGEYLRAGCQNHKIEDWRQFSKRDIAEMDGRRALKFYPRLLDVIDFYISKGPRPEWLNEPEVAECEE